MEEESRKTKARAEADAVKGKQMREMALQRLKNSKQS
jgi:hypothetical protein